MFSSLKFIYRSFLQRLYQNCGALRPFKKLFIWQSIKELFSKNNIAIFY